MEEMMQRLMLHPYWDVLRLEKGGNRFIRAVVKAAPERQQQFLLLAMMGFYPLSHSILEAFRKIKVLSPNEEVSATAQFFVDVEEGKHAVSDWYRNVLHSELLRGLWSSFGPIPLAVDKEMLNQYRRALDIAGGGLSRALVTTAFIEKTGLSVLELTHDFTAQWQTLSGRTTRTIDLTYLNEHMLHEGTESEDQHVALINSLLRNCGTRDLDSECTHFEKVTTEWFDHINDRIEDLVHSC